MEKKQKKKQGIFQEIYFSVLQKQEVIFVGLEWHKGSLNVGRHLFWCKLHLRGNWTM